MKRMGMIGLGVSTAALLPFLVLAVIVAPDGAPTSLDWNTAVQMQRTAVGGSFAHGLFVFLTEAGGIPAMTMLAIVGAWMLLLLRRDYILAGGWVVAAAVGGLLNVAAKTSIDRPRPPSAMRDRDVHEQNESFPSGHAMGATIGYGSLAYVTVLFLRRRRARVLVVALLTLLVLGIGCSRIYLRAHWVTDVIAGFAIGASWLAICITGMEVLRRRFAARET